jgi:hypothetical protein
MEKALKRYECALVEAGGMSHTTHNAVMLESAGGDWVLLADVRALFAAHRAETKHDAAGWFSQVMGAAASLEDAAASLTNTDAANAASGAAAHYRKGADELYAATRAAHPAEALQMSEAVAWEAERYRWLRSTAVRVQSYVHGDPNWLFGGVEMRGPTFDSAIDAAMRASKEADND